MSDTYRAARRAHRQLLTYIALLAILCIVLALTSCSSEAEKPAPAPATAAAVAVDSPVACEDVWQAGAVLPEGYESCTLDDGSELVGNVVECSDGTTMAVYEPSMWGITGEEIHETATELADDKAYSEAYYACIA